MTNGYETGITESSGTNKRVNRIVAGAFLFSIICWVVSLIGMLTNSDAFGTMQWVFAGSLLLVLLAITLYERAYPGEVDTVGTVRLILVLCIALSIGNTLLAFANANFPLWILFVLESALCAFGVLIFIVGDTSDHYFRP